MTLKNRSDAFVKLGQLLRELPTQEFDSISHSASIANPWFTPKNVKKSFDGLSFMLEPVAFQKWIDSYQLPQEQKAQKKIGLIMAGNIPAVGFHDLLCVLLCGHAAHIKLSKDDSVLINFIIQKLISIAPEFKSMVVIADQLKSIDALIATGTDNTAKHLDYYFSQIPRLIRRNRTSIGILDGTETSQELNNLGADIFTYFGLGCRNISKVYVPIAYNFDLLFQSIFKFKEVANHHKYFNNYEYHRAIFLMNLDPFLDNNFLMIKESKELVSPISVLYFEEYLNTDDLLDKINLHRPKIQCIVSKSPAENEIKFGNTQSPSVSDYADNVDTIHFLSTTMHG